MCPRHGTTVRSGALQGRHLISWLIQAVTGSGAPRSLQKPASAAVTGWRHCEQKRGLSIPTSGMEGKGGVTKFDAVTVGNRRLRNALGPDVGAVLAAEVAQPEGAIARFDTRVMARNGRVIYHDIVVQCAPERRRGADAQWKSLTARAEQARAVRAGGISASGHR